MIAHVTQANDGHRRPPSVPAQLSHTDVPGSTVRGRNETYKIAPKA